MNNSSSHPEFVGSDSYEGYSVGFIPVLVTIKITIIALAIAGNSLVCLAVALNSRLRRSATNYFLVSLAVADILTASTHMTLGVDLWLKDFYWSYSEVVCEFYAAMYLIAAPCSILNLLAVSVDRYLALSKPLQYRHGSLMTRKKALLTIASLWTYSFITALLPVMGWNVSPHSLEDGACYFNLTKGYILSSSVINFFIPMVIMCIIYGKIYRIANAANVRQNARPSLVSNSSFSFAGKGTTTSITELRSPVRKSSEGQPVFDSSSESGTELQPVGQSKSTTGQTSNAVDNNNKKKKCPVLTAKMQNIIPEKVEAFRRSRLAKQGRRERNETKLLRRSSTRVNEQRYFRSNMKAAQTVALIVSCFVLCWMPHTIVSFTSLLCPECFMDAPLELFPVLLVLAYANSCINPFLYGLQRRDFRNTFKKILKFHCASR